MAASALTSQNQWRGLFEVLDPLLWRGRLDDRQDHELGRADGDEPIDRVHQRVPALGNEHGRVGEVWAALGEQLDTDCGTGPDEYEISAP